MNNNVKNYVQLTGNLGVTPVVRVFDNGSKLARFSLATNERYTNKKGETATETSWHNVVAWGRLADIAEKSLERGKEVTVNGRIVTRDYTDKNGIKRRITEIEAKELLPAGTEAA